jgi:hypothetical protein
LFAACRNIGDTTDVPRPRKKRKKDAMKLGFAVKHQAVCTLRISNLFFLKFIVVQAMLSTNNKGKVAGIVLSGYHR